MADAMKGIALAGVCAFFLSACVMDEGNDGGMSCWAMFEETGLEQVRARILLEDQDGNVPDGARVLVESPANEVSWAYYSSSSNMYETTLTSVSSGLYRVSVNSAAGNSIIQVPLEMLTDEPEILSIQDSSGTVSGQGTNMRASSDISLEWNRVEGATVYKDMVCCGASAALVFSTTDTQYLMRSGTLVPGKAYALTIEAQYLEGDPYLRTSDHYAFTYSQSPEYYFTLQ